MAIMIKATLCNMASKWCFKAQPFVDKVELIFFIKIEFKLEIKSFVV